MRKTVEIIKLTDNANAMLLNLPDEDVAGREAVINLLESTLHGAGSYQGFMYLDARAMKASKNGTTVGINEDGEFETWSEDVHNKRFAGTDRTRVKYFS